MTITATGLTEAAAATRWCHGLREVGLCGISEGTVFPARARLEREGHINARLASSSAGLARKYYRPTADGHSALTAGTANWQALANLVNAVLTASTPSHPTEGSPR